MTLWRFSVTLALEFARGGGSLDPTDAAHGRRSGPDERVIFAWECGRLLHCIGGKRIAVAGSLHALHFGEQRLPCRRDVKTAGYGGGVLGSGCGFVIEALIREEQDEREHNVRFHEEVAWRRSIPLCVSASP